MNVATFKDWAPIRLHWEQGRPLVEWGYLGEARFVAPFFDDTIEHTLRRPFSLLFRRQTPPETLCELAAVDPGLPPTGFIFHMSRCGSTLAAQMLAALPEHIVISEAGSIDGVLRANWRDPQISDETRIAWLRGLLSAYARPRHGERHFFVKFDSWHTLELGLIQQAFPDVPWIFLYRDPVQVLVSHSRQPGAQMVHGLLPPAWLGLDQWTMEAASQDEYKARVLARICEAALQQHNANGRFVNYRQLPTAVWEEIAVHFRLIFSAVDREQLQQVAQFDAKNPRMVFQDDTDQKMQMATATQQEVAQQWLLPVYHALETR